MHVQKDSVGLKNRALEFVRGKSLEEGRGEGLEKEWGWTIIKIYYRHVWNFEAMKKVKGIFSQRSVTERTPHCGVKVKFREGDPACLSPTW